MSVLLALSALFKMFVFPAVRQHEWNNAPTAHASNYTVCACELECVVANCSPACCLEALCCRAMPVIHLQCRRVSIQSNGSLIWSSQSRSRNVPCINTDLYTPGVWADFWLNCSISILNSPRTDMSVWRCEVYITCVDTFMAQYQIMSTPSLCARRC